MPFAHALADADSALSLSLVTEVELRLAAARSPNRDRGHRIRIAAAADGRAENAFESVLRALVLEAGFASFEPQVPIRTAGGLFVVDLADRARRLVIEGDSYTKAPAAPSSGTVTATTLWSPTAGGSCASPGST